MSDLAVKLQTVESPCIDICRLDESDVCVGCFRTAHEIGSWLAYSDEERGDIMERLSARAEGRFD